MSGLGAYLAVGIEVGHPAQAAENRVVESARIAARVEVHRAAWKSTSIPYIDGRPVDPDAVDADFRPT